MASEICSSVQANANMCFSFNATRSKCWKMRKIRHEKWQKIHKEKVNFPYVWYVFKYQIEHFKHQHICQIQRKTRVPSRRCDKEEKGKVSRVRNSVLSERWSLLRGIFLVFECDCMRLFWLSFQHARISMLFFLAHRISYFIQKKAAKDVFIQPKATRLFNNSFERRNFQLLLMVSQGLLLAHPPIHTNFRLVSKDSDSNKTLKKAATDGGRIFKMISTPRKNAFAASSSQMKSRKLKREH